MVGGASAHACETQSSGEILYTDVPSKCDAWRKYYTHDGCDNSSLTSAPTLCAAWLEKLPKQGQRPGTKGRLSYCLLFYP